MSLSQSSPIDNVESETGAKLLAEDAVTPKATDSNANKKMRTVEQKARNGYRRSQQYLRKMKNKDPMTLSSRDRELIGKHTRLVAKYERKAATSRSSSDDGKGVVGAGEEPQQESATGNQTAASRAIVQRRRYPEESGQWPGAKRPRSNVPTELQIAIVDRNDPLGKIAPNNWLKLEARIMEQMLESEVDGEAVDFDGAGWLKGIKIVNCSNRKSLEFLTETVSLCGELWPSAKLEIISRSVLPLRQIIISLWVPPPVPKNDESTLRLIGLQNKNISTQSWRIISSGTSRTGSGKDHLIAIDHQSWDILKGMELRLKFGLGVLRANLHRTNERYSRQEREPATRHGANYFAPL